MKLASMILVTLARGEATGQPVCRLQQRQIADGPDDGVEAGAAYKIPLGRPGPPGAGPADASHP